MAPVSVDLKLISGKDIKAFNFFQKLSIYATVSIFVEETENQKQTHHQKQKTPVDKEGDANPEWNHEIKFDLKKIASSSSDLDPEHVFIQFNLICEAIIFGNKTIGQVRVPLHDLVQESNGTVRFVSYQVKSPDGNPNGVLHFSYKVTDDKIGSTSFYPVIDSFDFQVSSPVFPRPPPVPESYYPTLEASCDVSSPVYPPLPTATATESYCPMPEACCEVSSPVYPPPPPYLVAYYPPPAPMGYHAPPPPPPYEYGYGGYSYAMCAYPTVEHLQHQRDEDTWTKEEEFRRSWNVR